MRESMSDKTALIAMSGGVDSSVTALLLQEQGFTCEGATMRLYRNEDIGVCQYHTCCSARDIDDAADVAFKLHILYKVLDYTAAFKNEVIAKFVRIYEQGGTPNPCIDCNRFMKFRNLWEVAQKSQLNYVATGHYARIEFDREQGLYVLKKGIDASKDQSYVLYMLTQEQMAHTLFPLGGLTKKEVREIAAQHGLVNAHKHDSQDICFVPGGDYGKFLEEYTGKTYAKGDFLDIHGKIVGQHKGAVRYTIGQRKKLGIALGKPVYVCGKDMVKNTVRVGDEESLLSEVLVATEVNWLAGKAPTRAEEVWARTRYKQQEQAAVVYPIGNDSFRLEFAKPQRAVAPGQAVVLYRGDVVVAGGTIAQVLR